SSDGPGCETHTDSDVTRCGSCESACPAPPNATPTCVGGTCGFSCQAGFADCNMMPGDGCEVDLSTDAAHCGACNNRCVTGGSVLGVACVAGACDIVSCMAPLDDC